MLRESKGGNLFSKFILTLLKLVYVGITFALRIFLGKKRRLELYTKKGINFADFLYTSIELLHLDNYVLLVFEMPKYGYRFYSPITRKIPNFLIHDVYASMADHERDIVQQFQPKVGDIVVDIGAAFGFYTILSAYKVGIRGKVIAIEPDLKIYKMLKRNIKLNRLTNVSALNYAAFSKETGLKLYSTYSLLQERAGEIQSYVKVNANTLDNLLQKNGIREEQVNWIKIDVEGAEFEVLKGAHNILSKNKDITILIEIHGEKNYRLVKDYLTNYNFKIQFEKSYDWGDKHIVVRK